MDAITLGKGIIARGIAVRGSDFDWGGQCERSLYYGMQVANGDVSQLGYDSAKIAYQNSQIASLDMSKAPAGSVSFWSKSALYHNVINLGNGFCLNTSPLMKGKGLVEFTRNLRITRLADYFPDLYLGWSLRDGQRPRIAVDPWLPAATLPPSGNDWATNPPNSGVQLRIQIAMWKRGRYAGVRDGVFGPLSWKGIQKTVANVGYDGLIDGIPGFFTCHFVQVYAQKFGGYKGPIDSILGPNSWEGFARGLEAGLK